MAENNAFDRLCSELEKIRKVTESRIDLLSDILQGKNVKGTYAADGCIHFLISRKWNSWYPSFVDVRGGCYAFITSKYPKEDEDEYENNPGVIVIDPGFGFLPILRELYNIEFRDIGTLVVSHFHPDHAAGLTEFITLSHEAEHKCKILLNETSFGFFKDYRGGSIDIREIREDQGFELCSYKHENFKETIFMMPRRTFHREIGERHRSLSFIFNVKKEQLEVDTQGRTPSMSYNIGILGDTDGHSTYKNVYLGFISELCLQRNVLLLHLGTISSRRYGCGYAHLYDKGVASILRAIDTAESKCKPEAVILSEFGLELGSEDSIARGLRPFCSTYNWRLFPFIAKYYNEEKNASETPSSAYSLFSKMAHIFIEDLPATCVFEQSAQLCLAFPLLTFRHDVTSPLDKTREILNRFNKKFLETAERADKIIAGFKVKLPPKLDAYKWILNEVDDDFKQEIVKSLTRFRQLGQPDMPNGKKVLEKFANCLFKWSVSFLSRVDADIRYARDFRTVMEFSERVSLMPTSAKGKLTPKFLFLQSLIHSLIMKNMLDTEVGLPKNAKIVKTPLERFHHVLSKTFPNLNIIISDIGLDMRFRAGRFFAFTSEEKKWLDPESGWIDIKKIGCQWKKDEINYIQK